ncbi:MAG: RNA polymerase sigma factor [Gemmatimonadetes bacterium]|nr:RNA polymerase sigma factor [Gemmatimonadota bacterium]
MTVDDLYGTYASSLSAHARYLTRDKDQADDLFQDTFIRAMKHLGQLGTLSPPQRRAWLYRTMRNLFVDKTRARQREAMFLDTWFQLKQEESSNTAGWESGPGHLPDMTATMTEIMKHVPEKHRDLVYMRFVLGLTSREIAERTGVPAGTVRFRLYAEIRKLRVRISRLTQT